MIVKQGKENKWKGQVSMKLSQLVEELQEGEVAQGKFAGEIWYIKKSHGFIRYCNRDGGFVRESVPLTKSNLEATYKIIR